MAVKSVVAIDVNDKQFQAYLKLFNQYQAALKHMPGAWKQINQATGKQLTSYQSLVNEAVAFNAKQKLIAKAQEHAGRITKTTADRWKEMSFNAKSFAASITSSTRSILRWGSIGGVISGLLGLTSLWGLDRLGASAGANRRSALGRGLTVGQQQAFDLSFGRLVDTGSFVGGVNESLIDVTKRRGLYNAGISDRELSGKNTAEVSELLVRRLKQFADKTPDQLLGTLAGRFGFGQFGVGGEELLRLKHTSGGELEKLLKFFAGHIGNLNQPDKVGEAWQDFTMKLDTAGKIIETELINKLVKLAPGLGNLSESVVKVIKNFTGTEAVSEWLTKLGKGVEEFAVYVGSEDFQSKIKNFVHGVGELASSVLNFLKFFHIITPDTYDAAKDVAGSSGAMGQAPANAGQAKFNRWMNHISGVMGVPTGGGTDLLSLVKSLEGSGTNAVSRAGAIGTYQIMPNTARSLGGDPSKLFDPVYNEAMAKAALDDLRHRTKTLAEVLVGYNASSAVLRRFIASGDNPMVLPAETQKYLRHAEQLGANLRANVSITLDNRTGANPTIAAKQAGIGVVGQ